MAGNRLKKILDLPPDTLACTIAYNYYGGYCLPRSSLHRPASKAVQEGRVYERKTIAFMMANCGDGDIIHAGTYFGDFLPALSGALSPKALLWAFEPNAENYRCAEITGRINMLNNIKLTNAGLGESQTQGSLKTVDPKGVSLGGASRIVPERMAGKPGVTAVDIVSLDKVIPEDRVVSVLQLDVEGYEKAALQGAMGIIRRCRPILILEQLDDGALTGSDWFEQQIASLGYSQTGVVHSNVVFEVTS